MDTVSGPESMPGLGAFSTGFGCGPFCLGPEGKACGLRMVTSKGFPTVGLAATEQKRGWLSPPPPPPSPCGSVTLGEVLEQDVRNPRRQKRNTASRRIGALRTLQSLSWVQRSHNSRRLSRRHRVFRNYGLPPGCVAQSATLLVRQVTKPMFGCVLVVARLAIAENLRQK